MAMRKICPAASTASCQGVRRPSRSHQSRGAWWGQQGSLKLTSGGAFMILVALTHSSAIVVASSKANPDTLMTSSEPQTHHDHGVSTGSSSVEYSSRWRTKVSSGGPYLSKHEASWPPSATRILWPARTSAATGRSSTTRSRSSPGTTAKPSALLKLRGTPSQRGRPVRSSPGAQPQAALGHIGHLTIRSDLLEIYVDRPSNPTWPDATRLWESPQCGGRRLTVRT